MPMLAKAAVISNARKLIKEYENQHNILAIAIDSLNENAEPEKMDDNWLAYFFEKAKHVSKEDIALILGKILAEEINNPNTISRYLIHILSIIDHKDVVTFLRIANFTVQIEEEYYPIILFNKYDKNSIDISILKQVFLGFSILGKLSISPKYNLMVNQNANRNLDKNMQKEYVNVHRRLKS